MVKLLKLEWSKFRKNTTIVLLLVFFALLYPSCLYFGKFLKNINNLIPINIDIYKAPYIWEYLGYAGNWMVFFFLGVLIIYTITIDVSNKTMRQSVINGLTRTEFYLSKLLIVLVISLAATAYYTLMSFIFGWLNTDEPSIGIMLNNDWAISRFFLMSFGYMVFAMFLAFLFRKAGLAVFFYLTYVITIEPLLKLLTNQYVMSNKYVNYFPMNVVEDLMPNPLFKMAKKVPADFDYDLLLPFGEATVLTIIYCLLFLGITYYSFLKRDI